MVLNYARPAASGGRIPPSSDLISNAKVLKKSAQNNTFPQLFSIILGVRTAARKNISIPPIYYFILRDCSVLTQLLPHPFAPCRNPAVFPFSRFVKRFAEEKIYIIIYNYFNI